MLAGFVFAGMIEPLPVSFAFSHLRPRRAQD